MDAGKMETGRLDGWSLSFDDHAFLSDLPVSARLAAAVQLKFLDQFGYFPSQWAQVGDEAVVVAEHTTLDQAACSGPVTRARSAAREFPPGDLSL